MALEPKKYGMPLLCSQWIKPDAIILAGGGGSSATGIKNKLMLISYKDDKINETISEIDFGKKYPIKSCWNKVTDELIVAFGNQGAMHVKLNAKEDKYQLMDISNKSELVKLAEKEGQEISCLSFSPNGENLYISFINGSLRSYEWPAMIELKIIRGNEESTKLKDIDINNTYLTYITEKGDGKIIKLDDMRHSNLFSDERREGDKYVHCKIITEEMPVEILTTIVTKKSGSYLCKWMVSTAHIPYCVMKSNRATQEGISSFGVSEDKKLSAIGTSNGDLIIYENEELDKIRIINSAHMVFLTTLTFNTEVFEDNKYLVLSASGDSSAVVHQVKNPKKIPKYIREYVRLIIFAIVLAIMFYLMKKISEPEVSGKSEL